MFTFTDQYGNAVQDSFLPQHVNESAFRPADVRHLALWIAAARAADDADHCGEYDAIAISVGGPTRDDLRNAGLLDSEFTVRGTRTVTVTVSIPFETTYTAARPGDVRRNFDETDLGDIDTYELREAIFSDYTVDSEDIEIDEVERL